MTAVLDAVFFLNIDRLFSSCFSLKIFYLGDEQKFSA